MSNGCVGSNIKIMTSSDIQDWECYVINVIQPILKSCWKRIFHEHILSMNDFSEDEEIVDLGREFQRDDTLLEKMFKDELILFTSE